MNAAIIALLAAQQAARQRIVESFERAGATSPATARPLGSLGELDDGALRACLEDGTVREGAPGTFDLWRRPVPASQARWTRGRMVKAIVFWIIVLLLPIAFLQFVNP